MKLTLGMMMVWCQNAADYLTHIVVNANGACLVCLWWGWVSWVLGTRINSTTFTVGRVSEYSFKVRHNEKYDVHRKKLFDTINLAFTTKVTLSYIMKIKSRFALKKEYFIEPQNPWFRLKKGCFYRPESAKRKRRCFRSLGRSMVYVLVNFTSPVA